MIQQSKQWSLSLREWKELDTLTSSTSYTRPTTPVQCALEIQRLKTALHQQLMENTPDNQNASHFSGSTTTWAYSMNNEDNSLIRRKPRSLSKLPDQKRRKLLESQTLSNSMATGTTLTPSPPSYF